MDSENISINTAGAGASYMNNPKRTETSPLQGVQPENRGLHVIISCLSVLTVIVSAALAAQMYYGDNRLAVHGAVASDNSECTEIGAAVLDKGGTAVDAAVAAAICMTLVYPHLTGIGGGGLMIVYEQRSGQVLDCLDFRASHPGGGSGDNTTGADGNLSGVGVPGFVAGLYAAHSAHGKLKWSQLITPTVQLARTGFRMSENLYKSYEELKSSGRDVSDDLKFWLSDLRPDNVIKASNVAETLEAIAAQGADAFYSGSIAAQLSGYVRSEDLKRYRVGRGGCIEKAVSGYKIVVPGHGSGGPLVLEMLEKFNSTEGHNDTTLAMMLALQGDEELNRKYSSGTGVVVMDDNDIYVSLVSGLGSVFGSQVMVPGGFLLNNALDYLSYNYYDSGSNNASSGGDSKADSLMLPVLAVEDGRICGRRLVTGGSDARDVAQLLHQLVLTPEVDLQSSVEDPRARLFSDQVQLERQHAPSLAPESVQRLHAEGFKLANASYPYPSLNALQKISDSMEGYADSRGQGYAVVF